ncbi:MAG: type II CRISPR-associated endonuclease Cas1 [Phycisphaerales bacterium]|nr:type II CRISPR-associated endonuclease Cas1 [Phycisphaerales bacterium]
MIKRTLYFGNPAYLKTAHEQLHIERKDEETISIPIEDIGVLILDHQQITITQVLMAKLLANNVALITCDQTHHPVGLMLNLDGHTLQSQKFKHQIAASLPLKKQLWQQTIICKIENQAAHLALQGADERPLIALAKKVKSGDSDNCEAQAAAYYWKYVFPDFLAFKREREGLPPNNLLNYGYAILRATVARNLVASGLLPTLGIHHRNQYNAYCLADDIMEPYRPYVDKVVCDIVKMNGTYLEMTPNMKEALLSISQLDVLIGEQNSPMMNAIQRTTASLTKCYEGEFKNLLYPIL